MDIFSLSMERRRLCGVGEFVPCVAEQVRNAGGHALVILDTLKPMIELWNLAHSSLGQLGPDVSTIVKDEFGDKGDADGREATEDDTIFMAPGASSEAFDLVEYEGMLVSATAAQRRR